MTTDRPPRHRHFTAALPFDDPDLVDRVGAAELLDCGERTVHNYRRAGKFPEGTVVIVRRPSGGNPLVRYRKSKLEQFLASDRPVVIDEDSDSENTLESES